MKEQKSCCFIGHRTIQNKEAVYQKTKEIVANLISDQNIKIFNFGSRSEFDDICHNVVTELQKDYSDIVRIKYCRQSECVIRKDEKQKLEQGCSKILNREVTVKEFEEEKASNRAFSAGKASYVERNQEMIDDSDYCIFFYNEKYKPKIEKHFSLSGKSGTKLAYCYAIKKKKRIINITEYF